MKLERLGLIFNRCHAQLPTPLLLNDRIRIFYSSKDNGKSFISYIDVDKLNPKKIIYDHVLPVLNVGEQGCFDDSGVMPSSIIKIKNEIRLYYTGWNLDKGSVPYGHGIGMGIFENNIIKRLSKGPIIDRSIHNPFLTNSAFVTQDSRFIKQYSMYYCSGTGWLNNVPLYVIKKCDSIDGINWKHENDIIAGNSDEAISRPCCFENHLFYSYKTASTKYKLGYSKFNEHKWTRRNEEVFDTPPSDWESEMVCYPYLIKVNNTTYMFYNGNGYGASGIGVAKWTS